MRSNVTRGGHDDTRLAKAGDQPPKETPGSFGVSARLHKDIQHVPVRIHRPPQRLLHAVDQNDDFVQMPLVGSSGAVTFDATGEMPAKSVHPFAHGFAAGGYTAFGKKILDVRSAEREAMTGPHRVGHDFTRKTIAFQARHLNWYHHAKTLDAPKGYSKLAMPE